VSTAGYVVKSEECSQRVPTAAYVVKNEELTTKN